MSETWNFVRGLLFLLAVVAFFGWVVYQGFKRSAEPGRILVKALVSAPVLGLAAMAVPWFGPFGPFLIVGCAVILSVLWTPHIGACLVRPLTSLFDGGDREPDQRPLYSIAQAQRKRGNYSEAVNQVRRQLEKFPHDFEGQLLLAEIEAENLNDLQGAEVTVHRLCEQSGHPPRSIVFALNSLADWHLKYGQDRDSAKAALEEIITRYPESEWKAMAEQRIAHLASTDLLIGMHDRKRFALRPGVENIGLLPAASQPKAPEADPARQTAECVEHLAAHPLDTEARERLALLYAHHYGRLDLAAGELEQMIAYPGQPMKRVAHWLNVLADLQVQHGAGYDAARHTLQRIIDLSPDSAAAHNARHRLDLLRLELKARGTSQTVRLGSYEQDIGLKGRLPHQS